MSTMVIKENLFKKYCYSTGVPDEALWMEFFGSEEASLVG